MNNIICLLIGFFMFSAPLSAQHVSATGTRGIRSAGQACQIALRLWEAQRASRADVTEKIRIDTLRRAYLCRADRKFVLVSSVEDEPEILGYGRLLSANDDVSVRSLSSMPLPLQAMLNTAVRPASFMPYPPQGANWHAVSPLLTTVRHQEAPYNRDCPYYRFDNGTLYDKHPCVVGCVATAMEQILTYYRREYTLLDTLKGWTTPHYDIPDILPGPTVDTRLIRDNYDVGPSSEESIDAVARLSYYLGVSCHMSWGIESSGAQSVRLAEPLRRVFGLPYVNYLDAYKYEPSAFWNYLAAEIMASRPVYYAGSLMRTGGHAFVLDGLDADGLFHVNWGYGGDFDGYFRLDVLAHPQPLADRRDQYVESGFFCNQEAITLCPDPVTDLLPPDTLARTGREVVVDSLYTAMVPVTGCHTPMFLHLRNTADVPLNASFAFLLNAPGDTALVRQADCIAFTGRNLRPGERDTLCVHAVFGRAGDVLLSVTPDGEQIIKTVPLKVADGGTDEVEADVPVVSFEGETTAVVRQRFTNPSATERAAHYFIYDLLDCVSQTSAQVLHYVYVAPGGEAEDSVRFAGLVPGRPYTLRLRRRWPVVQTLDFTMPGASSVPGIITDTAERSAEWYSLDGRRVARPECSGLYLRRRGNVVDKVFLP